MRQVFLNPRIWIALAVMASIDVALQLGAYRQWVSRDSHAGLTMRALNAIDVQGANQIDSVTIGSSVAVHGLAHQRIAEMAASRGAAHANLSLPGSALLTFRQWGKYLPLHLPNVKAGILVLSPTDFRNLGNGSYELAIVAPMKSFTDGLWWQEHVRFDRNNLETYGLFSGLALYRLDIQHLIANPNQRRIELQWWLDHLRAENYLTTNQIFDGNVCDVNLQNSDTCQASPKPADMEDQRFKGIQQTCQNLKVPAGGLLDWRDPSALHAETRRVQQLRRNLFKELGWTKRSLVVVLPMHPMWDQVQVLGAAEIMHETYQPLVDQGLVRYVDLRDLFVQSGVPACQVFHDLYHLNGFGQKLVTDRLMADLAWMYAKPK